MFIESFLLLLALNFLSAGRVNRPEGRIIGGGPIEIEQAPWQVSIQNNGSLHCGGSIYSDNIIITAAHCFFDENARRVDHKAFKVRAGSALDFNGTLVDLAAVITHEKFLYVLQRNDIAIVRLSKPLEFTSKVQPIPLAKTNPAPGSIASVSGWGVTYIFNDGTPFYPKHLQGLTLHIMRPLSTSLGGSSQLCAGTYGKTVCHGDSGGPLVVNKQLVGVVSMGDCSSSAFFSSVPYYREWILNAIASIQ
ncbi:trypsin alpha-like [Drosophila teissieri]|uniref:trypsin alpha-like n=1 Tax=Drosophila teissieri TaxID=7243 RepID=UPI001CB9F3CD|nr:trypsin alpha-like [Drosophila teissieri]